MTRIILANSAGGVGMPAAVQTLQAARPALDVVEAGIRPVELDPTVRSVGVGGWPNLLGQVELDGCIMDGRTLQTGAVGALQGFLHPISVARQVMERLPHVFLVGEGAARFAAEIGAEAGPTLTDEARREWEAWLASHLPEAVAAAWPSAPLAEWARLTADPEMPTSPADAPHGRPITLMPVGREGLPVRRDPSAQTAGLRMTTDGGEEGRPHPGGTTTFVVKDMAGEIASGVSTCGWAFKYPGRLGDSPVIGAGSYADNRYGAAACTGMGELTIRAGTARAVVLYMKMGMSVHEACQEALADLRSLTRHWQGGVTIHAIDAQGEPHVVSVGRGDEVRYWIWMEGMAAPEEHRALIEAW